ncbi:MULTISPECIES: MFS transporter [Neobacillus]|uniref:MFS transporter n=1 Tax=Neobacillus rhizophilus TaxID=2833579 RepID=A0A942UB48_9BACI|nr:MULTISPECIES: MFS transporter [Neobacillus]MBS4216202.1 MFS transporter [Neobacillus rhizophilus]MBU8917237.1 MFS transporter [Bacillus sp. FJAT-29953]
MPATKNVSLVKNRNFLIVAIALGVILNPLNTTMITVALPEIKNEFLLTSKDITWLIASYFIVSAIFLPLIGKLSDTYGRKRIFLFGLLLVGISSFTAPLSPNMPFLLGMRTIQAIGTSALYPAGIGIVRSYIQKNQNRVIGTLSVFATTSAAFGPTISGLLIELGGWHVIFYVNFPIIIVSAILAVLFIPNDVRSTNNTFKWDGIGIILFSLFISCWMYFFQTLANGLNVWALIGSLALTFLFYFFEKKKAGPFIDVLFLKNNPNISLVYVQYILATVIFFALLLSMPIYLQSVLKLSSQLTGIIMLSISIFSIVTTPLATRWIDKSGYRKPLLTGGIIGVVGGVLLLTINHNSPLYWIFIVLATIGLSNGILNIGLQTRLYSFVSVAETGTASGLFMTSRFIGNILASSVFGVIFAAGVSDTSQNWLTIILLIVSFILLPGILFITKKMHGDGSGVSASQ